MKYWESISIQFAKDISNEKFNRIYNVFHAFDCNFPKECLNGSASYLRPKLNTKIVLIVLFEAFNIDDAIVNFSPINREYDFHEYENVNNYTYKDLSKL